MTTYNVNDLSPIEEKNKGPGQPGEPGEKSDEKPEPGDEKGEGEGEPTDDETDGDGGGEAQEGDDEEGVGGESKTPDQVHKEIQDKLNGKSDVSGKDPIDPRDVNAEKKGVNATRDTGKSEFRKVDKLPRPKFSWKELIRQFVSTAKHTETTYAKMHRRTITAMTGVATTGAGAIKPGERPVDEAFKLAIIYDSTGSMHRQMPTSLAETEKLIKDNYGSIAGIMAIGMYGSNIPSYFALNLETKKFWNITSFGDLMKKPPAKTMPMGDLFKMASGGGNELPPAGAQSILSLISQGFNVVMITDTDITAEYNWKNLISILKTGKSNFFLILDSDYSFQVVVKKLGSVPNNIGHF